MAVLPGKIKIDLREGHEPITIDGQPFPWYVSAEVSLAIEVNKDDLSSVRLTLVAGAVELIPADDDEL